ncbi:MAG: hypothetical protein HQK65_02275 [Desulfamplus sp.]|nr:hypothetical protein [Desulfamplus sp.]
MAFTADQKKNLSISRVYTGTPFSEYDPKTGEMKFLLPKPEETSVKIFNNPAFGEIRTVRINQEPWFSADDVCRVLGYVNPRKAIQDHCKGYIDSICPLEKQIKQDETKVIQDSSKGCHDLLHPLDGQIIRDNSSKVATNIATFEQQKLQDEEIPRNYYDSDFYNGHEKLAEGVDYYPFQTAGGIQKCLIISEFNIYRLIFRSRMEAAIRFQDWVYRVVLPDIRRTGMFLLDNYFMDEETQSHGLAGYSHLREPMELKRFIATYELDTSRLIWDMAQKNLIKNAFNKDDELRINLTSFKNLSFSTTAIGCGAAWHDRVQSLCDSGRPMVHPIKLCKILKYHVNNKLVTTISRDGEPKTPLFKDYAFGAIN